MNVAAMSFVKTFLRFVLVMASVLLCLLLAERLWLNPRPLTTIGIVVLLLPGVAVVLAVVSLWTLRTRWETVSKAWLVLVSSIVAYAAADLVTGALLIHSLTPSIVPSERVHHRPEPGKNTLVETTEYSYVEHINELGLRGAPVTAKKDIGTYRILMLGDSFTMGRGVPDGETFSALLQDSMNRPDGGGSHPRVEVLNGGVDSYCPLLSRLQLLDIGSALSPDLVVLNLDMSDLLQEQAYRALAIRDSSGAIIAVKPRSAPAARNRGEAIGRLIDKHLLITRWIAVKLREVDFDEDHLTVDSTVIARNPVLLRHTLADDMANREAQWNDLFESILGIIRYADEHRIKFLLTIYPWGHQANDSEWTVGRRFFVPERAVVADASRHRVARFAELRGLSFLDMFPAFREYRGGEHLYFSLDMHWTPAGHRLAAAQLERTIRDIVPW